MRNILVTGGTTKVGELLIQLILKDPESKVILALEPGDDCSIQHRNLRKISLDLTKERQVKKVFTSQDAQDLTHIVHLAMHRGESKGFKHHRLNVDSTRSLIILAEEYQVSHFIFRSWAEIYESHSFLPTIVTESHPIDLSSQGSQWLKDRVEADQILCAKMGLSKVKIKILRSSDCLASGCGSQIYSFLDSRLCFTPFGYDPMLNVVSPEDLAHSLFLALDYPNNGVFDIPGLDNIPLSEICYKAGKGYLAIPEPILGALSSVQRLWGDKNFDYKNHRKRFKYGAILSGERARKELGYQPKHGSDWNSLKKELNPR